MFRRAVLSLQTSPTTMIVIDLLFAFLIALVIAGALSALFGGRGVRCGIGGRRRLLAPILTVPLSIHESA